MNVTRLTRRRMLQGTAGLAVAGLAGCTSSSDPDGDDSPSTTSENDNDSTGHDESEHGHGGVGEPQDAREVAINTARGEQTTEYHFDPHVVRVTVGGTVTWTLESGSHTATAYHPETDQPRLVPEGTEAWDSGTLNQQGQTYEHTFDTEGVYHYYCEPHEQFGMLATVIVGEPNPDESIALNTIPSDKPEEVRGKLRELNEMCRSALEGGHSEESDSGGHHDDETTTDDGHHEEGTTTEDDHHEEETTTEDDHHEETTTEEDHHEETTTEEDHHEEENTTSSH